MIIELGYEDTNGWVLGYYSDSIGIKEYVELGYDDDDVWVIGYLHEVDPKPIKLRDSVELGYKSGCVWHLGGKFDFRRKGFNHSHMIYFLEQGATGYDFNSLAVSYYTGTGAESNQFNSGQKQSKNIIGFEGYSPIDDRNIR